MKSYNTSAIVTWQSIIQYPSTEQYKHTRMAVPSAYIMRFRCRMHVKLARHKHKTIEITSLPLTYKQD